MIVTTVVLTNAARAKGFPLSMPITYGCSHTSDLEPLLCLEPNGDQWNFEATPTRPQNSYPILARGLEGFNIPHLGRIVHHAVQTPQNVPLATASTAKSCHAFFNLLSLHRSFAVKHAGFDCTKSETFILQSKYTSICRCIYNTRSSSHLTTSE